jgi:hypothetical protein
MSLLRSHTCLSESLLHNWLNSADCRCFSVNLLANTCFQELPTPPLTLWRGFFFIFGPDDIAHHRKPHLGFLQNLGKCSACWLCSSVSAFPRVFLWGLVGNADSWAPAIISCLCLWIYTSLPQDSNTSTNGNHRLRGFYLFGWMEKEKTKDFLFV